MLQRQCTGFKTITLALTILKPNPETFCLLTAQAVPDAAAEAGFHHGPPPLEARNPHARHLTGPKELQPEELSALVHVPRDEELANLQPFGLSRGLNGQCGAHRGPEPKPQTRILDQDEPKVRGGAEAREEGPPGGEAALPARGEGDSPNPH